MHNVFQGFGSGPKATSLPGPLGWTDLMKLFINISYHICVPNQVLPKPNKAVEKEKPKKRAAPAVHLPVVDNDDSDGTYLFICT